MTTVMCRRDSFKWKENRIKRGVLARHGRVRKACGKESRSGRWTERTMWELKFESKAGTGAIYERSNNVFASCLLYISIIFVQCREA